MGAGWCTGRGDGGSTGRFHSPVVSSHFPVRTTRSLLSVTVQDSAVYTSLYPLPQNFLAAISDEWESPGIMCASVMLDGSHGMLRLQVCIEVRMLPSGMVTCSSVTAGFTLMAVAFVVRKWVVAEVSLMALYVLR